MEGLIMCSLPESSAGLSLFSRTHVSLSQTSFYQRVLFEEGEPGRGTLFPQDFRSILTNRCGDVWRVSDAPDCGGPHAAPLIGCRADL